MTFFKNSKLRAAAMHNDVRRVKALLADGANPDTADSYGDTVTRDALNRGCTDAVRLLIEHGATVSGRIRIDGTLLHMAAGRGYTEIARLILDKKPETIDAIDEQGSTPLHVAAMGGREPIVRLLMERRPGLVNAKNGEGDTPLHLAALSGHAEIVALLLEKGAEPAARNSSNRTPLFLAQAKNQLASIEILRPLTPVTRYRAAPEEPDEEWKKLSGKRIARVMTEEQIGYRITEIFNFESRERLRIVHNLETRADQTDSRSFEDFADKAAIEAARLELQALGGNVPETALTDRLNKLPPPRSGGA